MMTQSARHFQSSSKPRFFNPMIFPKQVVSTPFAYFSTGTSTNNSPQKMKLKDQFLTADSSFKDLTQPPGTKFADADLLTALEQTVSDISIERSGPDGDSYSILVNSCVQISIVQNDVTAEDVDAITNSANMRLKHGGGVAAAIVRKGGR